MDFDSFYHREPIAGLGVSVVVPAFNESCCLETTVANVVQTFEGMERSYEIVLVDDGSTDGTHEIVDRMAASNRRIRVVHHAENRGYGAALWSGFQTVRYPLVLQLDGNDRYLVAEMQRLLDVVDYADIVCGIRKERKLSIGRRMSSWLFRWGIWLVFAVPIRDVTCGFRLYRRRSLRQIPLQSSGRFCDVEILAKATFLNMLVAEVAVTHSPSETNSSDRCREPFISILRESMRVFWRPQFALSNASSSKSESAIQAA